MPPPLVPSPPDHPPPGYQPPAEGQEDEIGWQAAAPAPVAAQPEAPAGAPPAAPAQQEQQEAVVVDRRSLGDRLVDGIEKLLLSPLTTLLDLLEDLLDPGAAARHPHQQQQQQAAPPPPASVDKGDEGDSPTAPDSSSWHPKFIPLGRSPHPLHPSRARSATCTRSLPFQPRSCRLGLKPWMKPASLTGYLGREFLRLVPEMTRRPDPAPAAAGDKARQDDAGLPRDALYPFLPGGLIQPSCGRIEMLLRTFVAEREPPLPWLSRALASASFPQGQAPSPLGCLSFGHSGRRTAFGCRIQLGLVPRGCR